MADAKISALTPWTTPIATDVLPIVDVTAGSTKKIAYSDLTKGQVAANAAISAATKTKITYDVKGLVTSGTDATCDDISDGTNTHLVSTAQLGIVNATSGSNTGDNAANTNIPAKAAAADVDTGTNDTKFTTALSISGSHNVPNAVPSTIGNIMTSDGTDWISSAAPAGGDALMVQVFS